MRYAALVAIFLSYPLFLTILRSYPRNRSWAFATLGALLFFAGPFRVETFVVDWPMWPGTVRGLGISPVDMLALALIVTRQRTRGHPPFWVSLVPYGLVLLLSVKMSSMPMASMFVVWQYCRILLLFAALAGEAHMRSTIHGLINGLSLGLVLQAAVVIQQKLGGVVQAAGTMPHQNILGMVVELALLPIMAFFLAGERSKIAGLGLVAAMVIIAGGGSRAAVAFSLIGMAVYCVISLVRNLDGGKLKIIGTGVFALLLISPVGYYTLNSRLHGGPLFTSEDERASYKEAARSIASDHPLGVGANTFVTTANLGGYSSRAGVAWNTANRSAPVHHAYLLARAETGWQGELAFIAFLTWPAVAGFVMAFRRRQGVPGELSLGCALALGINIVHNNFEYAAHTYVVQSLIIVNIAMIAAQIRAGRIGYQYLPRRGTNMLSRAPKPPTNGSGLQPEPVPFM